MNDINVYVDAEDNINIKDDKQIIKLQVRFEDLTESQKQQLKGEKGDRGEKGLKGDPGEPGPRGLTGPAPDTSEFMVKDELEQIIVELRKINGGN
ncbi:collagen-like triple helix repeat-containing protein [Veillonella parvula]|jgi:hypothetical protein|uniref:collagen-like triple helix repeat-containing protein n=1 Tax=Veillonella parvula TaxID=29466 RepID=UPI00195FA989|nr:collagen-like protein [Veillonella parvula]VTY47487.1 Uncharacterised protein [Veillonella parvula]